MSGYLGAVNSKTPVCPVKPQTIRNLIAKPLTPCKNTTGLTQAAFDINQKFQLRQTGLTSSSPAEVLLASYVEAIKPTIIKYIEEVKNGDWIACGDVSDNVIATLKKAIPQAEVKNINLTYDYELAANAEARNEFAKLYNDLWKLSQQKDLFTSLEDKSAQAKFDFMLRCLNLWLVDEEGFDDQLIDILAESDTPLHSLNRENLIQKILLALEKKKITNVTCSDLEQFLEGIATIDFSKLAGINFNHFNGIYIYFHVVVAVKIGEETFIVDGTAKQIVDSFIWHQDLYDDKTLQDLPPVVLCRYGFEELMKMGYVIPPEILDPAAIDFPQERNHDSPQTTNTIIDFETCHKLAEEVFGNWNV